jgi:hypothetical protein
MPLKRKHPTTPWAYRHQTPCVGLTWAVFAAFASFSRANRAAAAAMSAAEHDEERAIMGLESEAVRLHQEAKRLNAAGRFAGAWVR